MIKINSIALTAALCGFSGYADAAGCHPDFSGSTTYVAGDWVSASSTVETTETCACSTTGCPTSPGQTTGCEKKTTTTEVHNYQCVSGENSAYCSMDGFEPAGQFSGSAWTKESAVCVGVVGSMSPTASPNFSTLTDAGGCPDAWEAGVNKYEENDKVSKNGLVFQCAAFPSSGF